MFDLKKEYSEEIAPIVNALKKKCFEHGIPMFFCAAVSDDEKRTEYNNERLSAEVVRQDLHDDRIAKMVNVILGYNVIMPSKPQEMDFAVEDESAPVDADQI